MTDQSEYNATTDQSEYNAKTGQSEYNDITDHWKGSNEKVHVYRITRYIYVCRTNNKNLSKTLPLTQY